MGKGPGQDVRSPGSGGAADAQSLEARLQSGRLQAEQLGRAFGATDAPARVLEHCQDMGALDLVQSGKARWVRGGRRRGKPVAQLQDRSLREDHGALDGIS